MSFAAVILAAGKSKRMKSALPKAVHPICGKAIARHIVDACRTAGAEEIVVVIGHEKEAVMSAIGSNVQYAVQEQQLGTGDAAKQALPFVDTEDMVLLPGDSPLITSDTISALMKEYRESRSAATLLTAIYPDPAAYGRIVRDDKGQVERIVEARDASPEILAIAELATSIYCFSVPLLKESLAELSTDNAQGEYYLTDVVSILRSKGHLVTAKIADDWRETLGINTRSELADAASAMRKRINTELMSNGVTIVDPNTTYIDAGVRIGRDTVIHPCTVIAGNTVIGEACNIGPFSRLTDATLGNNTTVASATVTGTSAAEGETVEPYSVIRRVGGA